MHCASSKPEFCDSTCAAGTTGSCRCSLSVCLFMHVSGVASTFLTASSSWETLYARQNLFNFLNFEGCDLSWCEPWAALFIGLFVQYVQFLHFTLCIYTVNVSIRSRSLFPQLTVCCLVPARGKQLVIWDEPVEFVMAFGIIGLKLFPDNDAHAIVRRQSILSCHIASTSLHKKPSSFPDSNYEPKFYNLRSVFYLIVLYTTWQLEYVIQPTTTAFSSILARKCGNEKD